MMHFHGFKSKADLKAKIKSGEPVRFADHAEETSTFGAEYKGTSPTPRNYCVCMDPQKRTKFANITVVNGLITKVQ